MAERGDPTGTEGGREVRLHLQRPFPPQPNDHSTLWATTGQRTAGTSRRSGS